MFRGLSPKVPIFYDLSHVTSDPKKTVIGDCDDSFWGGLEVNHG